MVDEVLIDIHISTPATKQNDNLYRSLADAYLDFEPYVPSHNAEFHKSNGLMLASAASRYTHGASPSGPGPDAAEISIVSTSKESYGSFPSHLSSGGQNDDGVNEAENESIPTSSRLARLDRMHRRWKELTPKGSFSTSTNQRRMRPSLPISAEADTAFIEDTQLGAQALQSQLQDSYSTTGEDTSEDEAEPNVPVPPLQEDFPCQASQRSTRATRLKSSSILVRPDVPSSEAPLLYVSQESVVSKPVKTHVPVKTKAAPANVQANVRSAEVLRSSSGQTQSKSVPQASNNRPKLSENDSRDGFNFSKLALDAYPPAPNVSVERHSRLPSQITKHLAATKAQNPKRFRTSKKHRTPKADERGYWSINCSTWSRNLQHEFWISVCEHVQSGRLGWGASLHRDASSVQELGRLRLYCWAEVAEHMWLILWLCSQGKVAGSQTRWIDADGSVVFEVA
jgi:hypothetical protein